METEFEKEKRTRNPVMCNADEIWSVLGKTWALLILKKLSFYSELMSGFLMLYSTV